MADPAALQAPQNQGSVALSGGTVMGAVTGLNQGTINVNAHPWQPRIEASPAIWQPLLDAMPLDEIPDLATLPPVAHMPYAPNPHFVGRDDDLLALARALKGGERIALGPRAAATGLGGIGKTSVAVEFVHRYGQYFAGGVFWLNCAVPAAVPGEVAACGGPGLLDLHPTFNDLPLADQVALVRQAWQHAIPRLLIFDNCEETHLVQEQIPRTGGSRVLITSRRQSWPSSLGIMSRSLDVLPRVASIALLQQLAARLSPVEADAVALDLGDFPLALHLAGSFLARYEPLAVVTYLQQLQDQALLNHLCLQGRGSALSPTGHDLNVGRTFAVSYDQLAVANSIDGLAQRVLAVLSWLAPGEAVPRDLLMEALGYAADDLDGVDAVARVYELGLVEPMPDGALRMHRLIHAFVQGLAVAAGEQAATEDALASHASRVNGAGYPTAMAPLVAHLAWATRPQPPRGDVRLATLCANLGYHYNAQGDYAAARPLLERALAITEQALGPTHPDTASSLNNLAALLDSTGDYAAARPLYERALAIYEQALGPTHPDTAQSLNNLAALVQATGDYAAARPLYERALAITEQALGFAHPTTQTIRANLAALDSLANEG